MPAHGRKPVTLAWWLPFLAAILAVATWGCGGAAESNILIASTTSTYDSGLFDVLLPAFTADNPGYTVRVNAVGTGEALELGRRCDADVLLVHAPEAEEQFVAAGYGIERHPIMYNDFVIVGPGSDPAGIAGGQDAAAAFGEIAAAGAGFMSRGDDSGTHKKEQKIWAAAGVDPAGDWYHVTGQGMGATLRAAAEKAAYTLTDRGTFLSMRGNLPGLVILVEGDPLLFNQYGAIAVNPENCPQVNVEGAQAFISWLESDAGQQVIGDFGREQYGRSLFVPDAGSGGPR